jgi:hypothetical protein
MASAFGTGPRTTVGATPGSNETGGPFCTDVTDREAVELEAILGGSDGGVPDLKLAGRPPQPAATRVKNKPSDRRRIVDPLFSRVPGSLDNLESVRKAGAELTAETRVRIGAPGRQPRPNPTASRIGGRCHRRGSASAVLGGHPIAASDVVERPDRETYPDLQPPGRPAELLRTSIRCVRVRPDGTRLGRQIAVSRCICGKRARQRRRSRSMRHGKPLRVCQRSLSAGSLSLLRCASSRLCAALRRTPLLEPVQATRLPLNRR